MSQRRLFYGWIVLAAAAAIICMGMGALFSLAVFLEPIEQTMGWSRGAIGSYVWLYGGSFAMALLAVLFALTFRAPMPRPFAGASPALTPRRAR